MVEYTLHTRESAPEGAKETLDAVEEKFGMVPNLTRVLAEAPAALKGYVQLSGLLEQTSFSPQEQQVVLLSVSHENGCDYCMSAHTAIAHMVDVPEQAIEALRTGSPIEDERLEALRRFTRAMVRERGWAGEEELGRFLEAGYDRSQVLEVILGIAMKTLSNYTNHVAGTPVDDAFAEHRWTRAEASAGVAAD